MIAALDYPIYRCLSFFEDLPQNGLWPHGTTHVVHQWHHLGVQVTASGRITRIDVTSASGKLEGNLKTLGKPPSRDQFNSEGFRRFRIGGHVTLSVVFIIVNRTVLTGGLVSSY